MLVQHVCRNDHEKCRDGRSIRRVKIAGKIVNNLRYADDTTLLASIKEDLCELIRRVKRAKRQVYTSIQRRPKS